jgi:hypothetical protein
MKTSHIALIGILLTAAACNSEHRSGYNSRNGISAAAAADSVAAFAEERTPATADLRQPAPINDPARKIIKTADLRCRVGDVFAAVTRTERLVAATGGQVSDSRMENSTDETRSLPYKPDSLRRVESYTTTAHLTLRIPVTALDTVLSDIAAGADFINNRSLHLDDVTLRYLSNRLKNEALAANNSAQHAQKLARHSHEAIYSGDYTDERNETRIDRQIENMQINDQVSYATLTVDLCQPQRLAQRVVPDIGNLMKPTVGQQAALALADGWQLLRVAVVGLLRIWPLLIVAAAGVFLFRYRRSRRMIVRA